MKKYKKPEIMSTNVHLNESIMTGSPGNLYNEEGNGIQLSRRQIWAEEEGL